MPLDFGKERAVPRARGPLPVDRLGVVEHLLVARDDGEPQAEGVALLLGAQALGEDLLAEDGAEVRRHVPPEPEHPALRVAADELQGTHHVTPRAIHRAGRKR